MERSRSKSPKRSRSKSPKRQIEESKDPLTHFMTPYLDLQSLSNLSLANKTFKNISQPELKSRKEIQSRITPLALQDLRRYALFPTSAQDFNLLSTQERINAKINVRSLIQTYETLLQIEYDSNLAMKIQRMKELANQISGETIFQV